MFSYIECCIYKIFPSACFQGKLLNVTLMLFETYKKIRGHETFTSFCITQILICLNLEHYFENTN